MSTNPQEQGKAFEERVEGLFRLLGFEVDRDSLLTGRQVDLTLRHGQGPLESIYLVECKDQGEPVGVGQVDSLFGRVLGARSSGTPMARGIFVTTGTFTRQAKAQATTLGIDLITFSALERSLIDLSPLVRSQLALFQGDRGVTGFVEPSIRRDGRTNVEPAMTVLSRWLRNTRQNQLTLLGDFGTGKTTFLRRLALNLAEEFLEGERLGRFAPAPIYIDLREYSHVVSIRQIILDLFDRHHVALASYQAFWHILREGRVVLLLDGFDELASKSNQSLTLENFREINRTALRRAKIILSCRTHYFVDDVDLHAFHGQPGQPNTRAYSELYREVAGRPNFQISFLEDFDDRQIQQFIRTRKGDDAHNEVATVLANRYNLADLARRPVLLEMILDSFERIKTESGDLTSATLYEVYTDIWLERNDWNATLAPDARRALIEAFAARIAFSGQAALHYTAIAKLIDELHPDLDQVEAEQCDRELRRAGFLIRDASGFYRFSHRSFQEFFLAKHLVRSISESDSDAPLPPLLGQLQTEVYRFVCDLVRASPAAIEHGLKRLKSPSTTGDDLRAVIKFLSRSDSDDLRRELTRLINDLRASTSAPRWPHEQLAMRDRPLAVAVTALGWLSPHADPKLFEELLLTPDEAYPVRLNALVSLLRSEHPFAGDAIAEFVITTPSRDLVTLVSSDVVARQMAGRQWSKLADMTLHRWHGDEELRAHWLEARSSAVVALCHLCGAANDPRAIGVLTEVVRSSSSVKGISTAALQLPTEVLPMVEAALLTATRRYNGRGALVVLTAALGRLRTPAARAALLTVMSGTQEGAAKTALLAVCESWPETARTQLYQRPDIWQRRHWSARLRLVAAQQLHAECPQDVERDVIELLGRRRLSDPEAFTALQLLAEHLPQAMPMAADAVLTQHYSGAVQAYACECLYRTDPIVGRQIALKSALLSPLASVREDIARLLRSDIDDDATRAIAEALDGEPETSVRIELAQALIAPGRNLTDGLLQGLIAQESALEVREVLEMAMPQGTQLDPKA